MTENREGVPETPLCGDGPKQTVQAAVCCLPGCFLLRLLSDPQSSFVHRPRELNSHRLHQVRTELQLFKHMMQLHHGVLGVEPSPLIPVEHGGRIDQQNPCSRLGSDCIQERMAPDSKLLPRVLSDAFSRGDDDFGDTGLQLSGKRAEEPCLVAVVMVDRASGDSSRLRHIIERDVSVASLREKLGGRLEDVPGSLRSCCCGGTSHRPFLYIQGVCIVSFYIHIVRKGAAMSVTSFYPVLMSHDVAAAAAFYRDRVGFQITFESDWYVSLRLDDFELALVAHDHPTIPREYQALPQGIIVNLEVENVAEVYQQITADDDVVPLLPPKDEDFGQRHFILSAPDGILLDVIHPIPPTAEYASAYTD